MTVGRTEGSLYDLLEVQSGATFDEIDASYHRITAYLDTSSLAVYSMLEEDDVSKLRSQVDEAYRTLSDPERRAAYDRARVENAGSYPTVVVPEALGGASVSLGRVSEPTPEPVQQTIVKREESAEPTPAPQPKAAPVPETPMARDVPSAPAPASVRPAPPASAAQRPRMQVPPGIELTPDTEYGGSLLRRLREAAGGTIDSIAEVTKISKRYLIGIEENDFDALPAPVYVRGFVAEYARALGLDTARVARSYMAVYTRYKGGGG